MNFNLYSSRSFLQILKKVYFLKEISVPRGSRSMLNIPFLSSRFPFKSKEAFSLPFGFYQTSKSIHESLSDLDWHMLSKYTQSSGINTSITSVGKLNFPRGVHVANNPILELSDKFKPFANYSKKHQQSIRTEKNKSSRYEISISTSNSTRDLDQFYNLMAYQYVKDHRMIFQPLSLFENLLSQGFATLFIAKCRGNSLGGLFCLNDDSVFHYNWGVRKRFKNVSVGSLLIDYAISYAHDHGYQYFDFGSTPLSDINLFNYKLKWGSKNNCVYKYFTGPQLPQIDLNNSFHTSRRIYSYFPPKLVKLFMPIVVPILVS